VDDKASGRFGPLAKPSRNDRYLRIPAGWSRRQADIAEGGRGRRNWADSGPTGGRLGKDRSPAEPCHSIVNANGLHRPKAAYANLERSASASAISGMSDVAANPTSAGEPRALRGGGSSIGRAASDSAARSSKLRGLCCFETAIAVRSASSEAAGLAGSRFASISPQTRCSSASNWRFPMCSLAASVSSRMARARSMSPAPVSASAREILHSS
jgi:hypothetical protein